MAHEFRLVCELSLRVDRWPGRFGALSGPCHRLGDGLSGRSDPPARQHLAHGRGHCDQSKQNLAPRPYTPIPVRGRPSMTDRPRSPRRAEHPVHRGSAHTDDAGDPGYVMLSALDQLSGDLEFLGRPHSRPAAFASSSTSCRQTGYGPLTDEVSLELGKGAEDVEDRSDRCPVRPARRPAGDAGSPRRPDAAIARASVKPAAAMGVVVGFQPAGDTALRNSRSMRYPQAMVAPNHPRMRVAAWLGPAPRRTAATAWIESMATGAERPVPSNHESRATRSDCPRQPSRAMSNDRPSRSATSWPATPAAS